MIQEAKDTVIDTASNVVSAMSNRDPFLATMLIAGVVLMGWYVYQDHNLKNDLTNMKLVDQKQDIERRELVKEFMAVLTGLQQQTAKDRELFVSLLNDATSANKDQFAEGVIIMSEISNKLREMDRVINSKLSSIINVIQLRSNKEPGEQK